MGFKSEMIKARDEFIALVKAELLGPGSEVSVPDAEHELITTVPEKGIPSEFFFRRKTKCRRTGTTWTAPSRKTKRKTRNRLKQLTLMRPIISVRTSR